MDEQAAQRRGPRAARPLVAIALALLLGSLLADALPEALAVVSFALAALAGAWAATCTSVRSAAMTSATELRPRLLLLAMLACLAFLRASSRAPPESEAAPTQPSVDLRAPPAFDGTWSERTDFGAEVRGRVEDRAGRTWPVEMPAGLAADGERIAILPASAPSRVARGPVEPNGTAPPTWNVRADEIVRVEGPRGWRALLVPLDELRDALRARCRRLGDSLSRQLAAALLIGDVGALDPELGDLFTRLGLRHVLAVSGMHVMLLAAICWWPVGGWARQRSGPRWRIVAIALAQAVLLCAYVLVAGNGAPVRRASVALALACLAPAFVRRANGTDAPCRVDGVSLLSLGLVLECIVDPRGLTSLSLQLSYAATLGLIVGTGPLGRLLRQLVGCTHAARSHGLRPASLCAVVVHRTTAIACSAVAASLSAVLATLPLCWSSFGEWSPVGMLATPLTLPLFAWLLAYGWLFVAAPGWLPSEGFELPARALVSALEVFDDLPGTPTALPARPTWLLLAAAVGVFLVLHWRVVRPRAASVIARACCAAWAILLAPWTPSPVGLELVVLDVGHGTAAALRAPGPVHWLFDCGSGDRTRLVGGALAPLLAAWEARELGIVVSHTDRDHASAAGWLVERYTTRTWGGALPAPVGERLAHTVPRLDAHPGPVRLPARGPAGFELTLLRGSTLPGNEGSRSLLVEFAGRRLLLCGDAEDDGLRPLLDELALGAPVSLLLWPHHGADTRWLAGLLGATRPRVVWISARGPAAVERELGRRGIPTLATYRDGPLRLELRPP